MALSILERRQDIASMAQTLVRMRGPHAPEELPTEIDRALQDVGALLPAFLEEDEIAVRQELLRRHCVA